MPSEYHSYDACWLYATFIPLMERDETLQPIKLQFVKMAESPETLISPADADEVPSKEFELHK